MAEVFNILINIKADLFRSSQVYVRNIWGLQEICSSAETA
jgi:hypothetical protein